jgi:HK97 family phage prohead protease
MSNTKEFRFTGSLRAKASKKPVIGGYAIVFNSQSQDLGDFVEVIDPNAFTACLATKPDIRCRYQHNDMCVLGRTPKTLRVWADSMGVQFECDIASDSGASMDVYRSIQRGDVSQMSFGMFVEEDSWVSNKAGGMVRTITRANIFEVSPVSDPAYTATKVTARALWPDGIPETIELRKKSKTAGTVVPFQKCCGSLRDADFDQDDAITGMVNWAKDDEDRAAGKTFNTEKLAQGFAYVDGDGSEISDYKLPHHSVKDGKLVHSLSGTTRAMSDLVSGAVPVPAQYRSAVTQHLLDEFSVFGEQDLTNDDSDLERSRRKAAVQLAKLKF